MRVAVITMAYNEGANLPIWLNYYGNLFGRQNLYVIDHGSDDGSTADIGANRVFSPREPLDEERRVGIVMGLHRSLLRAFDWVIYTDADELLVPDPDRYPTLADFISRKYCDVITGVGLNVVHQRHIEAPLDRTRKILRQRGWVRFHSDECKPLASRIPLAWGPGFHDCDAPVNLDPDLYLFHLKLADHDACMSRLEVTRNLEWSENAIRHGHGYQHRFGREEFVNKFFPEAMMGEIAGNREFKFDGELRHITLRPGNPLRDYEGRLTRIPERFKDIF